MTLVLRRGAPSDAEVCASICQTAFATISGRHNFPPDFPSVEPARQLMDFMLSREDVFSVVAELEGRVVGSNFLWETGPVAGVGPITVDPGVQNRSVGRKLMEEVLKRGRERRISSIRLLQAGYHARSLSLYAKLGFDVREPLVTMQGPPMAASVAGCSVRPATREDVPACNRLHFKVHGFERERDLFDAVEQATARVTERGGRVTGYATAIGFFGHAVGESNDDLKALIAAAPEFAGPGFHLPMRNGELFRWCLDRGLKVVQPMTLMSLGLYSKPSGAFLPSILY
jgi:GNAT superfamily N-acetyltransferase